MPNRRISAVRNDNNNRNKNNVLGKEKSKTNLEMDKMIFEIAIVILMIIIIGLQIANGGTLIDLLECCKRKNELKKYIKDDEPRL